ncbi:MAG: ATPase V [Bacteroidales bacterium]|nr:ATPase V [Bacteroidales bacterium]
MTKYSFILLSGDKEQFLEKLGELGLVDIVRSSKPVDERSAELLSRAERLRKAIDILEKTDGKASGAIASSTPMEDVYEAADALASAKANLDKAARDCERLLPWGEFQPDQIKDLERHGCKVRFYDVPKKQFKASWDVIVPLTVVSDDGSRVRFVTVSDSPEYEFPIEDIPAPEMNAAKAKEALELAESEVKVAQERLLGLKACLPALESAYKAALVKLDKYFAAATSEAAAEETLCVYTGFAPSEHDSQLKPAFEAMDDVFFISEEATAQDRPPISLKNNKFTRMFRVLTDMYGRPEYDGFDPTPYIAVFFMLFFAFCMGDCGYGLVLILLGLGLGKSKGMASFAPLVTTLGVATVVIGFLFHTFFSMDISGWEMFAPIKSVFLPSKIAGYDGTMVLALLVGVIHICLAIIVKTVYATKNHGFLGSLGTWGWTLLIVGGVIVGALSLGGVLDAAVTKWVIIVIGVLSALGIFFLNDLHRNPLINVGAGLWETYNTATGLLGDVLSYLRLYALGLAGAMLGFAFNDLGAKVLGDGAILNWVFFILIVLIGHVLNMAMAVLGAFVHPLRLNFLEFFKNSGYEGGARIYDPLKNTTETTIE